jgi:hypothetical protein
VKILTCFAAYVFVLHAWQAVSTHACLLLGAVQLRLQLHHALAADTCTGTPDSACTPCLNPQGVGIGLLYLHSGSFAHHHIVLAVTSNMPCDACCWYVLHALNTFHAVKEYVVGKAHLL